MKKTIGLFFSLALGWLILGGNVQQASYWTVGQIPGTTTNDSAGTGKVGEYLSASVASGSGVSVVSNTAVTVTSLSISAGNWSVMCKTFYAFNGLSQVGSAAVSLSPTNNTFNQVDDRWYSIEFGGLVIGASNLSAFVGPVNLKLSSTTTYYCVAQAGFTSGGAGDKAYGFMEATRLR